MSEPMMEGSSKPADGRHLEEKHPQRSTLCLWPDVTCWRWLTGWKEGEATYDKNKLVYEGDVRPHHPSGVLYDARSPRGDGAGIRYACQRWLHR